LMFLTAVEAATETAPATAEVDLERIRPDLAEALERHRIGRDAGRVEAVARRPRTGRRTPRENPDGPCRPGAVAEDGGPASAAPPPLPRRPHRAYPRRRPGRRHRDDRRPRGGGHVLRLHGPCGYAGYPEPPQDRPAAHHRRGPAAPSGDLR